MAHNYKISTIKKLFGLSGNKCAFSDCEQDLITTDEVIVADICHIEGEMPNSPRYNSKKSTEELDDFPNLILMCKTHHKVIDDREDIFTVEKLLEIKAKHEEKYSSNLYQVSDAVLDKFLKIEVTQQPVHLGSGDQIVTQTGDVNIEITSIDETGKLFQLLFERNFPKLRAEAERAARESVEDYCKTFMNSAKQKLDADKIEKLSDPDVQAVLTESIMEAGRKNDKELHEHLSRLMIERIQVDDNDLKRIVYNEAIKTIGKLTINQLKIITTCLLLRYITDNNLTSLEAFEEYIKKYIFPFLDFKDSFADFQHIEYTGCGSIMGVGSWDFMKRIKDSYTQFRHYVISSEDVTNLNLPNQVQSDLFELNQESSLEFKFKERKLLDDYLAGRSIENKAKIQEKFSDSQREGDGNWTEFINKSETIQKTLDVVKKTEIKSLSLTSVGVVIGIMYYEKITSDTISLEGWIS